MKSFILIGLIITFSLYANAQQDSVHQVDDGKPQNHDLIVNPDMGTTNNPDPVTAKLIPAKSVPDGYMIQDGKMMVIVNGKLEVMKSDATLGNGTRVITNGYFILKDGSKVKLKEGQLLDLNGEVIPRK